jgi:dihydrofolate reductase
MERAGAAEHLFIIGGASVYELFLPVVQRLSITWVDREVQGDTLFPVVDWSEWRLIASSATIMDVENRFPHRFVDYERGVP